MEETILIVCKTLGTGIAVIMGVLGILFEAHDKVIRHGHIKKKRLNKIGRIFLTLTIVSGTIALAAQIVEATRNRTLELENKARNQAVLTNLEVSVNETRRLVSQIRTIDAEITIPLVSTNAQFLALHAYIAQMALPYLGSDKFTESKLNELYRSNPEIRVDHSRLDDLTTNFEPELDFRLTSESVSSSLVAEPNLRPVYEFLKALNSKACQLRFCHMDVGQTLDNTIT